MDFLQGIADRLGVSVRMLVLGTLAVLAVGGFIIWRRNQANAAAGVTGTPAGSVGVVNGPWSSGADSISANPLPSSPDGGADSGSTSSGTSTPPPLPTTTPVQPAASGAVYVHPTPWPTQTSTLSGIASAYHTPLSVVEGFPENRYILARGGWDRIYTSDSIRVK